MTSTQHSFPDLFDTVVENGICIGCGACAAFDPNIQIKLDEFGRYAATRQSDNPFPSSAASRVCPFADSVPNEDELGDDIFGKTGQVNPYVGHHIASYAGWVIEPEYRARGSSGGLVSWLLVELFERQLVDYVVHVISEPNQTAGTPLFHFGISTSAEQIRAGAKSRYYPVEMSGIISTMLKQPGRYAVVGIPCHIKALRLASQQSPVLKERLAFTIGIVCGHLKSTAFAESFAWQCGVAPSELRGIDFRTKLPNAPAHSYAVTVRGEHNGQIFTVKKPTSELYGSNWGHGFFKYKACDFCDDVVGETADISIGDAWLKEYEWNFAGTNVVVVRSDALNGILTDGVSDGRLHLDCIPVEKVVESQVGGFRHRREGLGYRLFLEDEAGRWRPKKRVAASASHLSPKLRRIYEMRFEIGQASHTAFSIAKAKQEFGLFFQAMKPLTDRYDREYRRPLFIRILGKIKRTAFSIFRFQR